MLDDNYLLLVTHHIYYKLINNYSTINLFTYVTSHARLIFTKYYRYIYHACLYIERKRKKVEKLFK